MMHAFMTWLKMGGYAMYVWSAYGTVFVVLMVNLIQTNVDKKRTWRRLQRWMAKS